MASHCQERLILLRFVPVDSDLHFSLVEHLVPCVTTKDGFISLDAVFVQLFLPFHCSARLTALLQLQLLEREQRELRDTSATT